MKEYYSVEDLKDQYAESYDLIPEKYKDLRDRGYDIIDKVEIGGVLFVGINPSYDESRKGVATSIVRKSEAFAKAINKILSDRNLAKRMGDFNKNKITKFSVDKVKEQVIDLFNELQ